MTQKIIEWILNAVQKESKEKAFGSVTVFFQNGEVTHIKTERTEKLIK